jgi:hypothetical protein
MNKLRECDRSLRSVPRTADLSWCAWTHGSFVHPTYYIRVEHCEKPLEITVTQGGEKGTDNFSLLSEVGRGAHVRSFTGRRAQLTSCLAAAGGAPDNAGDFVEGDSEHVMQHERRSPAVSLSRTTNGARPMSRPGAFPALGRRHPRFSIGSGT